MRSNLFYLCIILKGIGMNAIAGIKWITNIHRSGTNDRARLLYFWLLFVIQFFIVYPANAWPTYESDSAKIAKDPSYKSAIIEFPNYEYEIHNVGDIGLGITNYGVIGPVSFPKGSNLVYTSSAYILIGGVVGHDTLVSRGRGGDYRELNPDIGEAGAIIRRSILSSSEYFHPEAVSEQDFIVTMTDTLADPDIIGESFYENRPHKPLNISIRLSSYAWSLDYAKDFILLDYLITNVGNLDISDIYIGFTMSANARHNSILDHDHMDYHGFRETIELPPGNCRELDTLNIAWFADDDGESTVDHQWDYLSLRGVIGVQLLRPRPEDIITNFNWITNQYSPRLSPTDDDPYRVFAGYTESPRIDVDNYYQLSHREVDYDQMFTAISHTGEGFMPPPDRELAEQIASGFGGGIIYSFGPFNLAPGDSFPFTMAFVAGENFHVNPWDYENYFDPYRPKIYYNKLDFSDLAENSRWARAVFDNPGVDTDGDGYSGEFCWRYTWRDTTASDPSDSFVIDSIRYFYTGDSIPDFRAMAPPPPPVVRVTPSYGKVVLRWNGQESENTPDYFSGQVDFEGYRVYYGEDNRLTDFVLLASYDIDDYIVHWFDTDNRTWRKISNSAKLDSLQNLQGSEFDPNEYYDQFNYFLDPHTGEIYYFTRQDWNQSDLSNPLGIHKVYPNASPYDSTDVTLEGWRRYYEYEYVIENLEPSKPYYFAVTAFDYGSFQYDVGQLETSPQTNAVREYPLPSADTVEHRGLNVVVYPNPYRIDGGYARAGYENRDRTKSAVWSRRIHFANLPNICTIRIFSIDGDLIKEIKHYNPTGGPESQHEEWNVVSRNTQAVVTGIYIWSVRSEMGEQLGKLVIIK